MRTELHRTFIAALESLPESSRELLTLHELTGLDIERISHVLGISRAQARIELLHARLAMRLRLFDRMRPATV